MELPNADLLSVGVTIAAFGVLAAVIFFSAPRSITARTFLAFSGITILWSIANYVQYQDTGAAIGIWIIRIIVFLGVWHAFTFFEMCYVFPRDTVSLPAWHWRIIAPIAGVLSIATLTPLVFSGVSSLSDAGAVTAVAPGPGLFAFVLFAGALIIAGIVVMARKIYAARGHERQQLLIVALGMALTFAGILIGNLILPALFNNARFLPLSAIFMAPLIGAFGIALYRYELFSIKVVATELFVFLLAVSTAMQVLFSADTPSLLFHMSTFILTLAFSILLVQSVIKEVRLRETIERQEKELEAANAQQIALLHFISHEVKGSLNKAQGVFAGLIDGDYGPMSEGARSISEGALREVKGGIAMVMDILDASNLKKGTISFDRKRFDARAAIERIVDAARPLAQEKGLHLELVLPPSGSIEIEGDEAKLSKHVFRNLVENAIHYTQKGFVRVSLSRVGNTLRFSVEDSGVGITPEDMARLFTEGGKGKDSLKVNVNSTGYGLFIAKSVVDAHRGTIKAESAGAGNGSRFIVELPA